MKLFNFLNPSKHKDTDNGVVGPTYLEGYTKNIQRPKWLKKNEWRRRLVSKSGNEWFRLRYYGNIHGDYKLIVRTDFAPIKIVAVDIDSNKEILLFDGCLHGYDAIFCDNFSEEQIENRPLGNIFIDKDGYEIFQIELSAYYNGNIEEEFKDEINSTNTIEVQGKILNLETAKRDGYDYFAIHAINKNNRKTEVMSEELA